MTVGRAFWLLGVAMTALVVNVVASILYMVIFGHLIDPGHEPEYYQQHIQIAGPYCSIVAGIPIMFFAGWLVAGWWNQQLGIRGAIAVWLAYAILDLTILAITGLSPGVAFLFAVSFLTKLLAACCGAWVRLRRRQS